MIKLLRSALCALLVCGGAAAIDLNGLRSIGPVASFVKTDSAVTLTCADGSQVRITVLAPDLIRVRAAFLGKLPDRDHSWAIEKTSWDVPHWSLTEEAGALRISTDELEVVVHRSPLQIEFRDVKTHQTINADQQPMRFDPQSGLIAAAKRLGFDEHFYGLGEKATTARQAPRRVRHVELRHFRLPGRHRSGLPEHSVLHRLAARRGLRRSSSTTATGPTSISAPLPRSTPPSPRKAAR